MSQGLHLSQRLSQQMVLSPQLQQSLALLQAPVLELKAMVEQELQQNPVLEEMAAIEAETETRETRGDDDAPSADPAEPPPDVQFDPATERNSTEPVDKFDEVMQTLLRMDEEWRDHFAQTNTINRVSEEDEERRQHMFDSLTGHTSLQEHLLDQVRNSEVTEAQMPVAEMIIGNIDDRGYLTSKPEELTFSTGVATEQIVEVLKLIQSFDPPGVGARDLRECLMLQLERAGRTESIEYKMLRDHMDALGKRRFPEIARHLDITAADAQEAAGLIAQLDPRPGSAFTDDSNQYVVPEITVERDGSDFVITSNSEFLPHLRISNTYKDLLSQAETSSEVREYIRDKIKAGKFLIKSLHQRQSTILNIANEIVKRQRDFFDKGVDHLRPMTMAQIAEVVHVHETTVSRAVSGKYMRTPQGIFEMKYFFTTGVATSSGENMSNTSVKNILADLITNEDKGSPLSDEELVARLKGQGIMIARRTVAKYRAELGVLPSHLRRSY
ncbi:MAG TPA: RNA polymerase factor sigma-54 [Candidatus Limnocylindria bacterium]|jgi:RNA polymerase sigma-54 factor|nr:RNA polymerase factor sigma-54 [Candidatus Limnocylindria bacterium]